MIALVLEAALKIFRSYLLGWLAVHHGFRTQIDAVSRFLSAPRGDTGLHAPMLWMDAFDALGELSAFEGSQSKLVLIDIPMTVVFLLFVALIGGPLVAVPISLTVAFGALTFRKGAKLQASLANRSEQDNKQSDFLVENLSGIQTLKALAIEPQIMRRFERLQKASALATYETVPAGQPTAILRCAVRQHHDGFNRIRRGVVCHGRQTEHRQPGLLFTAVGEADPAGIARHRHVDRNPE